MKNIAIYCGAVVGNQSIYTEETIRLGQWMASQQFNLVYGGGAVGLMGIMADTMIQGNRQTIGVMPHFLAQRELAHHGLDQLILVDNMHERKRKMIDLADCFIALPGGPGTLEEIAEVVSWGRIGEHQNPCIFYNVNGYYDYLKAFFEHMIANGFLTQSDYKQLLFTDSLDEIADFIASFQPNAVRTYQ